MIGCKTASVAYSLASLTCADVYSPSLLGFRSMVKVKMYETVSLKSLSNYIEILFSL